MPFHARVNDAIGRANSALTQLYSYNPYADPRSYPNDRIRNDARITIDPAYEGLKQGVREGRYEYISGTNAREALWAAEMIRRATFELSDRSQSAGIPANVPAAQRSIREALNYLYAARY